MENASEYEAPRMSIQTAEPLDLLRQTAGNFFAFQS